MGRRTAVLGASGYAGGELVRLVDAHPSLELSYLGAHTAAGKRLGDVHPHLSGSDRELGTIAADRVSDCELVFLALPHGASAVIGKELAAAGTNIVDLGSDFRLDTPARYAEAYGDEHPHPEELGAWAYGIPELFGESISAGSKTAAPGCYPTSAVLALAPLVAAGLIEGTLVVDSASGVTGAGRGAKPELSFGAVAESVRAYGVTTHRHRPEIEAALEWASPETQARVVFTPHLVPMQRGILSTCYGAATDGVGPADLEDCLRAAYAEAPFVTVIDRPPETRWTVGSNNCLLSVVLEERTGTAIVLSALDNLLKGAAGQAVQCANLMLGLDETAGLPDAVWLP